MSTPLIIIIVAIVVVVLFFIVTYNKLVTQRNNYKNAFSQIDVVLMRRHDLIPNLVEVAKKYMEHERETLESVISARNHANNSLQQAKANLDNPELMQIAAQSENSLTSALGRLMAVVENYPDLKADAQMQSLHDELATTENLIAAHRQTFNIEVTSFNNLLQVFPNNIVGGICSFKEAALLPIEEHKREVPKVQF